MDKPINPADPLDFLSEAPNITWTDARVATLIRHSPATFKLYAVEIEKWRSGRVTRAQAAAQVQREADEMEQNRRFAKSIRT